METQRLWARILGVVLLLVGLLGFFMASPLLGWFAVDATHSVIHLVTGAIFAWAGFARNGPARKVNQWLGIIYLLVAVIGFLGFLDGVFAINMADHWLHVILGVITALIGWFAR